MEAVKWAEPEKRFDKTPESCKGLVKFVHTGQAGTITVLYNEQYHKRKKQENRKKWMSAIWKQCLVDAPLKVSEHMMPVLDPRERCLYGSIPEQKYLLFQIYTSLCKSD